MPEPISSRLSRSSFRPIRSIAASTPHQRLLDVLQQLDQPALLQPRPLAPAPVPRRSRRSRRGRAPVPPPRRSMVATSAASSFVVRPGRRRARRRRRARAGRSPGGRLQQVGGEHRVVVDPTIRSPRGTRRQEAGAPTDRLRVVGDQGRSRRRRSRTRRGRLADHHLLAVGRGPVTAVHRDRRPVRPRGDLLRRALDGLDLDLALDPAPGDRLVVGQGLFEPREDRLQLELVHEVAQRARGPGRWPSPRPGRGRSRRRTPSSPAASRCGRRRRTRSGSPCASCRRPVDVRQDLLQRTELRQQRRGGLVADAGDARDVVRGVAACSPIRSVTSSG